jgi:serine/threonine protein kinase
MYYFHKIISSAELSTKISISIDDKNDYLKMFIFSANILLDKHFEAKMADFGLAKQANSGLNTRVTHVSQHGTVFGSKPYLPIEYIEDTSKLRREVDVYSFGIVCIVLSLILCFT